MLTSVLGWTISADQWMKYQQQFIALNPLGGMLSGDQLKAYFLSTGQPPAVLAQIWNLADVTKDGKLDQREFAIAMYLLEKRIEGAVLPAALPASLLSAGVLTTPMIQSAPDASPIRYPIAVNTAVQPTMHVGAATTVVDSVAWLASNKAKYSDSFNNMQQVKNGYLNGRDARLVLGRFGLSNDVLAHIWFLSDMDKDGRLTCEEFCLAMGYVDAFKSGQKLPSAPPSELVAAARRKSLSSASVESVEGSVDSLEECRTRVAKTFEDKRRENFEKGQAELERRRQQLLKMEQQEREERERKEREEQLRRERERQEAERRRQMELEKELARQREEQLRLEEEHRKIMEQREAARRQLERQRLIEWEKMRLNELVSQRQNIVENLCHSKQQNKNLVFQVQAFSEKASELSSSIAKLRQEVYELTESFGKLKSERDSKLASIESNKAAIAQYEYKLHQLEQEKKVLNERSLASKTALSLSEPFDQLLSRVDTKILALEGLQKNLAELDQEVKEKEEHCSALESAYEALRQEAQVEWFENQELIRQAKNKLSIPMQVVDKPEESVTSPTGTGTSVPWPNPSSPGAAALQQQFDQQHSLSTDAPVTVRYRALYEFVARTEDELSFQPGDIIFVFKNHASEPGWLAGQIKDKVGWFPEAFAECLDNTAANEKDEKKLVSPTLHAVQKLESINEESFEREEVVEASRLQEAGEPPATASHAGDMYAKALYNWKGKADNHLCFSRGNVIRILEQQEMWWKGELDGKEGWFPKSYVKIEPVQRKLSLTTEDKHEVASITDGIKAYSIDASDLTESNLPQPVERRMSAEHWNESKAVSSPDGGDEWCIAIYSFVASEPGDLAFNVGDKILVLQKDADWWTGRLGDAEGIFPANYVKPCEGERVTTPQQDPNMVNENGSANGQSVNSQEVPCEFGEAIAPFNPTDSNQLALELGDIVKIRTKSPTGWWEGEKEQNGSKRLGWFPGSYVKVLKSSMDGVQQQQNGNTLTAAPVKCSFTAEALYDYTAAQPGELSFKQGDSIEVVMKTDSDWWTGQLASGETGLFPANYVKIVDDDIRTDTCPLVRSSSDVFCSAPSSSFCRVSSSLSWSGSSRKRTMCFEELLKSENNYVGDLLIVRDVFQRPMIKDKSLSHVDVDAIFVNWNSLIKVGKQLIAKLKEGGEDAVGKVMLSMLPQFDAFATFGKQLRSALDYLDHRLTTSVPFRTSHIKCCSTPEARSLPLNYFLLIPMARFTKYPLMLNELLKYTAPSHSDYANLRQVLTNIKALCAEVNQLASETENLHMLHWCQSHIRCSELQPTLVFNLATNRLGPRRFLHAGIVHKAKSNRLLVAFLFNDMLMLTTPDKPIIDTALFKVSVNCEHTFTMYKKPMLLAHSTLTVPQANGEAINEALSCQLSLTADGNTVVLKTISSNARLLWKKQLEQAIEQVGFFYSHVTPSACINQAQKRSVTVVKRQLTFKHCIGRVSVEVQCVRNLPIPSDCTAYPVLIELKVAESRQTIPVDVNRKDMNALCSAQFLFDSTKSLLSVQFIVELQLSPSIVVGHTSITLDDMLKLAGPDRNPVVKQLPLTGQLISDYLTASAVVLIKFSVNMFND